MHGGWRRRVASRRCRLSTWVCGSGRRSGARLAGNLHLRLEDVPGKGDDPREDEVVQRILLRAQVGRGRAPGERGCLLQDRR